MPEICQIVQKVDYQEADGNTFFQIFKRCWVLININVRF